jgi:DNA-binding CsgD family transcriptional regulator
MPGIKAMRRIIDQVYDAAVDPAAWPHVLGEMSRLFGSASVHLSQENFQSTQGSLISHGADPDFGRSYAEYYVKRNVLWQRLVQHSLDGVVTDRTIMPKEELRHSEFFNDFLRRCDGEEILCSIAFHRTESTASSLTLWRPERIGAWDAEHMKTLAALTPHLRRAVRVNRSIGDLHLGHGLAREALERVEHGIVLLDAQGCVHFTNSVADAILADAGGICVERQCLNARRAADAAALHRLVARALRDRVGGSLVLARDQRPPLLVLIMPQTERSELPPNPLGAIVFIKDPERVAIRQLTAFTQHFGLTPAQAALARELMKGDGVTAIAARLGISRATVRTHLIHIFQKTATRRQAELVRLICEGSYGRPTEEARLANAPAEERGACEPSDQTSRPTRSVQ